MSAGDSHRRANTCVPSKVHALLSTGGAPELMRRWHGLSDAYDIPDLAGYNVAGTERYIDRDAMRAILDPAYAQQILGEPVRTGLSPKDTIDAILLHEAVEKVTLDADNAIEHYDQGADHGAHEVATCGEHELVRPRC